MKHVSTHTSTEVRARAIMVDDWIEIGGVLTRVIESIHSEEDDSVTLIVNMPLDNDKVVPLVLMFNQGWIVEIYNQSYPPTKE